MDDKNTNTVPSTTQPESTNENLVNNSINPSQTPTPDQPVNIDVQPGQGVPTANIYNTQQSISGNFSHERSSKKNKITLLVIVGIVIVALGAGGLLYMSKKESSQKPQPIVSSATQEINATIPTNWEPIKTDYGFAVMTPEKWEKSLSQSGTTNDLIEDTISIGPPLSFSYEPDEPDERNVFVSVGTSKLSNGSSQQEFEKRVTTASKEDLALLENFGYNKDDYKLSSRKIKLGEKEWLLVDSELPNDRTRKLFSWNNDKAVTFSMKAESETQLEKFSNKFLYPMASSIKFD